MASLDPTRGSIELEELHLDKKEPNGTAKKLDRPKQIIFIRHAQSTYNAFKRSLGTWLTCRCCGDPNIQDPPLSASGQKQTKRLAKRLHSSGVLDQIQVVIASPLQRAVVTALNAFADTSIPIVVNHHFVEIMDTSGDIGSPIEELTTRFPTIDFSSTPEHFWYHDPKVGTHIPIDEPKALVAERVESCRKILLERPEHTIAVVSHSSFLRQLTRGRTKLGNCCFVRMQMASDGTLTVSKHK